MSKLYNVIYSVYTQLLVYISTVILNYTQLRSHYGNMFRL